VLRLRLRLRLRFFTTQKLRSEGQGCAGYESILPIHIASPYSHAVLLWKTFPIFQWNCDDISPKKVNGELLVING